MSLVNAVTGLYQPSFLGIHFVYIKYSISVPYVFLNTQGTHKVYSRYTQGIHKVAL